MGRRGLTRPSPPPRAAQARGRSGGIARNSSRRAERVSDDLRLGRGTLLTRRRRASALTLGATAALGAASAHQLGLIRRLPDLGLPGVDSSTAGAHPDAYATGAPEASLGLVSVATTLTLAGMGAADRARQRPWVPVALAVKTGLDLAAALAVVARQRRRRGAVSAYWLAAGAAAAAAVPQVAPEARLAWRRLRP